MPVVLLIVVIVLVALLARYAGPGTRLDVRSCCSARPWPPHDLTGDRPEPPRVGGPATR